MIRLIFGRHVAVDDAHAAGLGHGDGEAGFGDRVHGRRNQRHGEFDRFRELGACVGLARQHVGGARHKQDVVKCQSFAELLQADPFLSTNHSGIELRGACNPSRAFCKARHNDRSGFTLFAQRG